MIQADGQKAIPQERDRLDLPQRYEAAVAALMS
jgi:hypothetical protein